MSDDGYVELFVSNSVDYAGRGKIAYTRATGTRYYLWIWYRYVRVPKRIHDALRYR